MISDRHQKPAHTAWAAVAMLFAVLALGACTRAVEPFVAPPDESYEPAVMEQGKELYLRMCSSCHGRDGGGGIGPNIRQVWERLSYDEHQRVLVDGRRGMPSFGRSLDSVQLEAIIAYERSGWDG